MAITRCENGHYFDDGKHNTCPHCRNFNDSPASKKTELITDTPQMTAPISSKDDEKTVSGVSLTGQAAAQELVDFGKVKPEDEKTVGIFKKKHGADPVTGWLVCIEGPERGRDYRLHSGRNFIGRAPQMDIAITGDLQISRENHCSVVFDPNSHSFMLVPTGANTYLNKESITEAAKLKDSDVIGLGESEFIFIPYCKEGRSW